MKRTYRDIDGIEVQPYYPTKVKLIKSGPLLEIYDLGRAIFLGRHIKKFKTEEEQERANYLKSKNPTNPQDTINASARRAKKNIRRLINANCFRWFKPNGERCRPLTLTLTFAENIQDLKTANYEFTKFIRRLNYEANKIEGRDVKISYVKYLGVFEKQKRGAIHYHLIFFNLPYIENIYDKMRNIWGLGRIDVGGQHKSMVKVKSQVKLKRIIDYFTKYIQKSVLDENLKHQKRYIASRDLLKPVEQYSDEVISIIRGYLGDELMTYYYDSEADENTDPIPYIRTLKYIQYDLSTNKRLSEKIDELLNRFSFNTPDTNSSSADAFNPDFDISAAEKTDLAEFLPPKIQPTLPEPLRK